MLAPAMLSIQMERRQDAPWGLFGGRPALANRLRVRRADGRDERFSNGKANPLSLAEGDVFTIESGGGGGFGDPRDRPAEKVLADLRAGYVSPRERR